LIPLIAMPSMKVRRATADEIAEIVVFLASDASRTTTGGAYLIDAGVSLLRA
jgi:enoyl-[acyl-carrier-protein] reductase (NADH)